tara:strand:+ start:3350 stop:4276 length:927 start_codon:yes stop_codon:yes gene_type:complete
MEKTMPEANAVEKEPELNNEIEVEVEAIEQEPEKLEIKEQDTKEEKQEKQETTSEDLEEYSEGVKKRISKLTAKMREAERRETAAVEYAQSIIKQNENLNKDRSNLDQHYVHEFENRLGVQEKFLQKELKEAIERGDTDTQVKMQTELAKLASENNRLAYVKQQQTQQLEAAKQQPQKPAAPPQRKPDPKANAWAEKNTWFGEDEPMTLTAFSIHKNLVEVGGYDPTSDEYYGELDKRIRTEFPHKFEDVNGTTKKARTSPSVASASRPANRSNNRSVKLSASQVAIAKKLGVSLEQYAKQVNLLKQS